MEEALTSYLSKTDNVNFELKKLSTRFKLDPNLIDFEIKKVLTYLKKSEEIGWEELTATELEQLENPDFLAMEDFEYRQTYELEFFPLAKNERHKLQIGIGQNPSLTKAVAVIKKGSYVDPRLHVSQILNDELNKLKLKKNIFINVWDKQQKVGVANLTKNIMKNKGIVDEDFKIVMTSVPGFQSPVDDKLIEHYKGDLATAPKENNGRVDVYDRGLIIGVKEGQLIMEYIKPQDGKAGRNYKGGIVMGEPAKVLNRPVFGVNADIRVEEDEATKKYYAAKKGFVQLEKNILGIIETIDFKKLDVKSTGHIKAGIDSGIHITISEKDYMKDAIGQGMFIEVTGLRIEGNIARDTKFVCDTFELDGRNHQESTIIANKANIKVHKGYVKANEVEIDRLEGGIVDADTVKVNEIIGGEIRANIIIVANIKSKAKIYFTKLLDITNILGDDNLFIATPVAREDERVVLDEKLKTLKRLEDKLKYNIKNMGEERQKLEAAKIALRISQDRLGDYKEKNMEVPKQVALEYRIKKDMYMHAAEAIQAIQADGDEYKQIKSELKELQENILNAKISKAGGWEPNHYSKIVFELVANDNTIDYKPNLTDTLIKLTKIEDKFSVESES